jgi:hypothetical protein
MKLTPLLKTLTLIFLISGCMNHPEKINKQLQGLWKLDRFEILDTGTGKWMADPSRSNYIGFIIYDGQGHMAVQIIPGGYADFNTDRNIDSLDNSELKEWLNLYRSNLGYFAEYKIHDSTIEHSRLSANDPKEWGTIVTRDFEFIGDTLILTPHEKRDGNGSVRLRWTRVQD